MWRDSNKTAARPLGHASIVDDGGESAVFHMQRQSGRLLGRPTSPSRSARRAPLQHRNGTVRPPAQREAD